MPWWAWLMIAWVALISLILVFMRITKIDPPSADKRL
jgi:hypothetical protein